MTHEEQVYKKLMKTVGEDERFWITKWFEDAKMFRELRDPITESSEVVVNGDTYYCRREAFFSSWDGDINYGYCVYKWDGTYTEKPLAPKSSATFKFKNWHEIFHTLGNKKTDPKEMVDIALKMIGVVKDFDS